MKGWFALRSLFKRFGYVAVALLAAEVVVSLIFSIIIATLKNSQFYTGYFGEDNICSAFLVIDYNQVFRIFTTLATGGVIVATLSAVIAPFLYLKRPLHRVIAASTGPALSFGFGGMVVGFMAISKVDNASMILFVSLIIFAAVIFYIALSLLASWAGSIFERKNEKDSKN